MQAARAVLGLGELELPGHATQVDSSVAPVTVEYFAAAQFKHVVLAVVIVYLPAAHGAHTPPSIHPVTSTSASDKGSPDEMEM